MIESVQGCLLYAVDDSARTLDVDGLNPSPPNTLALLNLTTNPVDPPTNPGGFFICYQKGVTELRTNKIADIAPWEAILTRLFVPMPW